MKMAKTSALTQRQLNKAYAGPEVELSERYGAIMNAVFVILMYSPGMPIIYLCGVIFFATAYWVDKITLLEIFKKPGSLDSTLVRLASDKFHWAIYLHLAFATWMFGSLHGVKLYVPIVSEIADSGLDDKRPGQEMGGRVFLTIIMDRLRNFPAFIPFSLLMGIIARDILKVFLKPMWIFSREYMARRKRRM
jgi:hypothetical protein